MVCKAWVNKTEARKRGSGIPYTKHSFVLLGRFDPIEFYERNKIIAPITVVRCGGKIIADIRADNEPCMGGTYAVLVVDLKCELCGCTDHAPDLPNKYTLNDWLTRIIWSLP